MSFRILSLAAALFAAAGFSGAAAGQSISRQNLTPDTRGAYVAVAAANDLYEQRAAEIALEKARRPEVRTVAETMLAEHRESHERLEEVARADGLGQLFPVGMMPMHWEMLRRLERSSGSRFDGRYLEQQQTTHEVGLALHRNFAEAGDSEALKDFARETLPMVARHLERLRALNP